MGAMRAPTKINFELLRLASEGGPLEGFTTDVAGMEFVRTAIERGYSLDVIEEFLDVFDPLFRPDNVRPSPLGRTLTRDRADLHNAPVEVIVHELTGRTRGDLIVDLDRSQRAVVRPFDPTDIHLVAAAVIHGADAICSSDTTYSMPTIGDIRILKPGRLAREFGVDLRS